MKLTIPELAVVALVGPSGSGKSSFARKHFRPTEVLSSDFCRGLVSDEENSQAATNDAFEVLYFIASKRLTTGKLVVIDATNVQVEARKPIIALARQFHCIPLRLFLICRRSFATSETIIARTEISVRTSYASSLSNYGDLCAIYSEKVFAGSIFCIHPRR